LSNNITVATVKATKIKCFKKQNKNKMKSVTNACKYEFYPLYR